MTRQDALRLLEEVLELPGGSLRGGETLRGEVPWDSMSSLAFIAEVDKRFGVPVPGAAVASCKTVADLLQLLEAARARHAA
jgi:acyl carrier protein